MTIPVADHENLDRITAETLVEAGVNAVVNAAGSATGEYPNMGPFILAQAGVYILDGVGKKVFERISTGIRSSSGATASTRTGLVAVGAPGRGDRGAQAAREPPRWWAWRSNFAQNTVEFMRHEQDLLFSVRGPHGPGA